VSCVLYTSVTCAGCHRLDLYLYNRSECEHGVDREYRRAEVVAYKNRTDTVQLSLFLREVTKPSCLAVFTPHQTQKAG
jgi:hypothetical protein